jgi:hypothetical protein
MLYRVHLSWAEFELTMLVVFNISLFVSASKALSLMPPIELSVLDDDLPIIDNDQLRHHKRHILIAKESRDMDNSVTPSMYSGDYTNLPDIVYWSLLRCYYFNITNI